VKLTIGLKLKPTAKQVAALRQTLELANQAANDVSRIAWETQTFGQYQLHKLTYSLIRQSINSRLKLRFE
jgi:putative transposase